MFLSKSEKIIKKEDRDFSKDQNVKQALKERHKTFLKTSTKNSPIRPLTQALSEHEKKLGYKFNPDLKKISEDVRNTYKQKIDKGYEGVYYSHKEEDKEMMSLKFKSSEENKRIAEQMNVFKKSEFLKNEKIRLLKKEGMTPEYYLPLEQIEDPTIKEQAELYQKYESNMKKLKNNRISNMLTRQRQNVKLGLLLESGLLEKNKNISEIIKTSVELAVLKKNQFAQIEYQAPRQHAEIVQQEENNLQDGEKDKNASEQKIQISGEQMIGENEWGQMTVDNKELMNVKKDVENISSDPYFKIMDKMDLRIEKHELENIDFNNLKQFYELFVRSSEEDQKKCVENLSLIQQIRNYENYLLEKNTAHLNIFKQNQSQFYPDDQLKQQYDILFKKKGRVQFKDLTEQQNLNYLKYNISNVKQVFDMFQSSEEIRAPSIVAQMIQKISTFQLREDKSILFIIKDMNYKKMLHILVDGVSSLNNYELIATLAGLAQNHQNEQGLIYKNLFEKLMANYKKELQERINYLNVNEVSFMSRQILKLNILRNDNELANKIFQYIDLHINEFNTVFDIQGVLLFIANYSAYDAPKKMLFEFLPILQLPQIQSQIYKEQLIDILLCISNLAVDSDKKGQIQALKHFMASMKDKIVELAPKMTHSDLSVVCVIMAQIGYHDGEAVQQLKKQMIKNIKELQKTSDKAVTSLAGSLAHLDVVRTNPEFMFEPPVDTQIILNFFPRLVFQQNSPQYTPYQELTMLLDSEKYKFKHKYLANILLSLSSLDFQNIQLYNQIIEHILYQKEIKDLEILNQILFSMNLMKYRAEDSLDELIEQINFLILNNEFKKITPLSMVHYIISVSNLLTEKEVHQTLEFKFERREKLIQKEKKYSVLNIIENIILPYILEFADSFSNNILLALNFSLVNLAGENKKMLAVVENLMKKMDFQKLGENGYLYLMGQQLEDSLRILKKKQEIIQLSFDIDVEAFNRQLVEKIEIKLQNSGNRFSWNQTLLNIKKLLVEAFQNQISQIEVNFKLKKKGADKTKYVLPLYFQISDYKFAILPLTAEQQIEVRNGNQSSGLRPLMIYKNLVQILEKDYQIKTLMVGVEEFSMLGTQFDSVEQEDQYKMLFLMKQIQTLI